MYKKIICILVCLTLTVALFSGCIFGKNKPASKDNGSQTATDGLTASSEEQRSEEPPASSKEESAESSSEPETHSKPQVQFSSWKVAYINYIEECGDVEYSDYRLVHVDNDGIPELFISGSCEASGSIICAFKNGKFFYQHLSRLGGAYYIPKSGLVHNFNGNMGCYSAVVYRLTDKGFVSLFYGEQFDSYEEFEDENGEIVYEEYSDYTIKIGNGMVAVTEEEFYEALDSVFTGGTIEPLYLYDDVRMFDYAGIKKQILGW